MKNKVNNIIISYWYKELNTNPISKIEELENNLGSIFPKPFLVNNMEVGINLSMPRIQTMTSDKTMLFTMSLVNATLSIHLIEKKDYDEVVLMVNENIQLFYDLLKEIYDVEIAYTSIKVDLTQENNKACKYFIENLKLEHDDYEDLSFKKVIKKDDTYYISYLISTGKEINFNIELKNNVRPSENDMFDRSMLISLSKANVNKQLLNTTIEINDRLAFNLDEDYLTTKENIRGMISELKDVFNNKIDSIIEKK